MAKDKDKDKKKKKKKIKEAIPAIARPMEAAGSEDSDNTLLYTILGVSAGLVLALAFGTERGREVLDRVAAAVNDFIEQSEEQLAGAAKKVKNS
jgi:hypothetical protein